MRILFVPYVLPPLHYPGALRNLKLLLGLSLNDIEIDVCHVDPHYFRHFGLDRFDAEMMGELPANVTYLPVKSKECNLFFKFINSNSTISRLFYFWTNPRKIEWTWAAKTLLRKRDLSSYDAVVTLSQPHSTHLLGLWLKREFHLPWVSYFSDPWIDNPYSNLTTDSFLRAYHSKLEEKVLAQSDKVLVTSEETREQFLSRYPDMKNKFSVLPHCFVPAWYPESKKVVQSKPIIILHCGNFYGPRSPRPIFEALAELDKSTAISKKIRLELVGDMGERHHKDLIDLNISHFVHHKPTVPYLGSLSLQSQADWLLVVDAPSGDKPSVFLPSKLMDYFGSKKPILGITPSEGASARVLKECGYPVHDIADHQGLKESLVRISEGWMPEISSIPDKYSVKNIGNALCGNLKDIIKEH